MILQGDSFSVRLTESPNNNITIIGGRGARIVRHISCAAATPGYVRHTEAINVCKRRAAPDGTYRHEENITNNGAADPIFRNTVTYPSYQPMAASYKRQG